MECNRDEALRAKEIAERKATEKDYVGAKKFALKAQNLFPSLEGISQMITTLDVYLAAEAKVNGEKDLYAILHVNASADEETVKKQYRKLALLLHPDKNKFTGAEGAFQLVSEAWNVLSDRSKKMLYDQRIYARGLQQKASQPSKTKSDSKSASNGFYQFANCAAAKVAAQKSNAPRPPTGPSTPTQAPLTTFWTSCAGCCMQYEYHIMYLNKSLLCPKCKQPFLATELPAPPSGLRAPKWPSKQPNLVDKNNNSSAPTSGFQHGASADSSSGTNFQWGPFSGLSATAGADGSSTVAQAANVVQQAYEKAKRQREEAQAAARREEFLRKRYNTSRRNANPPSNLYTGTGADINVNRKRDIGDDAGNNCAVNQNHSVSATRNTFTDGDKVTVDSLKPSWSSRLAAFNREFMHLDVRPLLVEKARFGILKKIAELNSAEAAKGREKDRAKNKQKLKEDIKESKDVDNLLKDTVHGGYSGKEVLNSRSKVLQKEDQQDDVNDDSDKDLGLPVSIDVPDPDFHDFDNDRTEEAFGGDQIWATYDDDDGMPRYYALIQKVLSKKPFKVRMSFLTSKSNVEFAELDWVSIGFSKTCGEFRVVRYEVIDSINIFSHKVKWEKGFRGVIRILPSKGDTWALYRNWTPYWNEHTSDDVIHKYDMVEVLGDYNEDQGVSVVSLVKVAGFKTVFRRHFDPKEVKVIPKKEMFRFSHQVPSYVLTGEEADNVPKGCLELDPAATPLELLQASTEGKSEEHMNDVEQ
ncbi:uncharacterized protein LOC110026578 [Phalaenopsis equestris]|uniref:uncharacterized protein LOC110026578 n=1 Tax=Phalaenopsis equestris TaxID=78828 RepID=UPI0009E207CF|nr:uncharacterized protein LOC110026578 [Phalaenopsis equestris]XP_020583233.1 uncharacterized protein LOC110026578 [Phalaenopsis equestris]XP_020583242.1 uncharacterized protein LOC110026578 [Phalaenopsis equestris]XP_020583249.1 uncharacterized protein LOC110026578 [Phalaenopsis equestris]